MKTKYDGNPEANHAGIGARFAKQCEEARTALKQAISEFGETGFLVGSSTTEVVHCLHVTKRLSLERQLNAAVVLYARECCQYIVYLTQQKLPRELKDLVYEYLFHDSAVQALFLSAGDGVPNLPKSLKVDAKRKKWSGISITEVDFLDRLDNATLPHFCKEFYVGRVFLQEFSPTFYRNAQLTLTSIDDIDECLSRNIFGNGCCPKDYLRYLAVVVSTFSPETAFHIPEKAEIIEAKLDLLSTILNIKECTWFHARPVFSGRKSGKLGFTDR